QHDVADHEHLTIPSPSTGKPVSRAYLLPRSVDDLAGQRRLYAARVRRAGAVAARLPQHLATVVLGLYDVRDLLGREDPAFAEHVAQYFEYCRENDRSIATVFSDPLHHRNHPVSKQEPLRVMARRSDGIVVRGAKGVGTQAPYANELFCMTPPRPDLKAEVLLGICAAIAESLGTTTQPPVQTALADAMVYLETLRAFIQSAEANPVRSPSGLAMPDPTMALAARTFAIEHYPSVLQHIRELCGPGLLMAPGQADLHNPDIGPHLHRYFVAHDEGAPERFRLLKLA